MLNNSHIQIFWQKFGLNNPNVSEGQIMYKVSNHAVVKACVKDAEELIERLNLNLIVVDPNKHNPSLSHNTFLVKGLVS